MKIPQHIINKANKIINNARENAKLEEEIREWINSKGVELDDLGDTIACLMYAEYEDGDHFARELKKEMDTGRVV